MLARNLLAAALLLLSGAWGSALAQRPASGARNGDDIHAQFQAAFSSGNAAAAADNLRRERRPRHAGRHRRREAIRKQIEAAMKAGLSDLAGDILLSRPLGKMTLRVGEWHAKWRGRPLHGFFTAILTYENGGVKMLEETTNVAPQ